MKKILIVAAAITAFAAHADVLYWMVDNPTGEGGFNWSSAKVVTDTNATVGSATAENMSAIALMDAYAQANIGTFGTDYTDATTFFIELYNASSEKIATANIGTAAQLASFIDRGGYSQFSGGGFAPAASSFHAVPEPTSGLLFLVGGMLLGLRRKRRV